MEEEKKLYGPLLALLGLLCVSSAALVIGHCPQLEPLRRFAPENPAVYRILVFAIALESTALMVLIAIIYNDISSGLDVGEEDQLETWSIDGEPGSEPEIDNVDLDPDEHGDY